MDKDTTKKLQSNVNSSDEYKNEKILTKILANQFNDDGTSWFCSG